MSDADAEEERAVGDGRAQGVVDVRLGKPRPRRGERADAGQHDLRRARNRRCVARKLERRANDAQGTGDVRHVGDRGVDEDQMTPFVLGTSAPTTSFAARSATAKALKIASAA